MCVENIKPVKKKVHISFLPGIFRRRRHPRAAKDVQAGEEETCWILVEVLKALLLRRPPVPDLSESGWNTNDDDDVDLFSPWLVSFLLYVQ